MKFQFLLRRKRGVLISKGRIFNAVIEVMGVYFENHTGHVTILGQQTVRFGLQRVQRVVALSFEQERSEHAALVTWRLLLPEQ
jgi:hypothetical protein